MSKAKVGEFDNGKVFGEEDVARLDVAAGM